MSATEQNVKKFNAEEFANLTAAQATQALQIDLEKNPKHLVNGTGAAIFYKIGNEFYLVGGYRSGKFLWVNGGQVKGETSLVNQIEKEFKEETFGVLPLTEQAKRHDTCGAYTYPFGTYISFIYIDTTSFSSKEELEACIQKMNPTAQFYNELFLHITANRGEKVLTPEEHAAKTEELIAEYHSLKEKGLLLVDVAANKEEVFFEKLRSLKNIGGVKEWYKTENDKFIRTYTIGEYSERSHYEALSLDELKTRLEKDKDLKKSNFFSNHTEVITSLMPEIEKATQNTMAPRVYSGRPGSPALYQPAPVAAPVEEAQKSTLTPNHV